MGLTLKELAIIVSVLSEFDLRDDTTNEIRDKIANELLRTEEGRLELSSLYSQKWISEQFKEGNK